MAYFSTPSFLRNLFVHYYQLIRLKQKIFQQRYQKKLWEELKGKKHGMKKLPYVLELATELVETTESLFEKKKRNERRSLY
ncbi:hypothetical protein GCM10020331_093840 [Ectobacillus funiculus]